MEDSVFEEKTVSCNLAQSLLCTNVYVIKSRKMRLAGHAARMREGRGAYSILVATPEGRRLLGRLRCRWDDNLKMDLQDGGWEHELD
jgi:hypothetical protein